MIKYSLQQQVILLRDVLIEVQEKRYHEPNSDYYETCGGCGRSPHNKPPHAENCLVPKITQVLKDTESNKY